jgi:hypothetical protein
MGKNPELVSVKEMDMLDQDPPVRGQKYACVSFLSPEKVLKQKDTFMFHKFIDHFSKDVAELFTNACEKFKEHPDIVDMLNNIKERHAYIFDENNLKEEYLLFQGHNNETLETEFYELNKFQTSIRGLKIRGCYDSVQEAQKRAENLKKRDPYFDVYVAEVGCWVPWDPHPQGVEQQEYTEDTLNTLMKQYKDNVDQGKIAYEERKQNMLEQSKQHSIRNQGPEKDEEASENEKIMTDADPWMQTKKV